MNLLTILRKALTPDPYSVKLAEFDRRISEARKAHKPVRHIMAERREFVHQSLRGEK